VTFLRSSLLISLVSLLVLTGYANEIFCDCQDEHRQEMTEHGKSDPSKGDDCQCICHQVFSNVSSAPMQTVALFCAVQMLARLTDEFPPDAVPLGIDHPPQLA
jgi:hypothetical protein